MHIACPHCLAVNRVPDARLQDDPTCGRCGRQVDLFTQHAGGIRENTYVFRAYCHGEMEETVLRHMDIVQAGREGIKAGVSFPLAPALPAEGCAEK